jgi:hypothetical protein
MTRERIILIIALAWAGLATANCSHRVSPEDLGRAKAKLRQCERHHDTYKKIGEALLDGAAVRRDGH